VLDSPKRWNMCSRANIGALIATFATSLVVALSSCSTRVTDIANERQGVPASGPTTEVEPTPTEPSSDSTPGLGPQLTEVFFDDFDGPLDESVWSHESPLFGGGDESVHLYQDDAVSTANGLLLITARRLPTPLEIDEDGDGLADRTITWQSGFITSRDRLSFTGGRYEIRARIPQGQGLWPAFWLRPQDRRYGPWPSSGELDVFEARGHEPDTVHWTAHWDDGGHAKSTHSQSVAPTNDGFHTFTLDWTSGILRWSVDGVVVHKLLDWETAVGPYPAPFDQAFFLNVNLAVGGSWPGPPDASTPDDPTLEVDWIRVFNID
jgi:beta-glucanase (GH16 family)